MTSTDVRPVAPDPPPPARPGHPVALVPRSVTTYLVWLAVVSAAWTVATASLVWHGQHEPTAFRTFDHHLMANLGWPRRIAEQLAELGDAGRFVAILTVTALVCIAGRSWRALLGAALSLTVVLVAVEVVLKPLVGARRHPWLPPTFPSGHTASACCLGVVAILLLGRRRGPLRFGVPRWVSAVIVPLGVLIGPAVGLSMVLVGAHTSVDVLGTPPLAVTLTLGVCTAVDRVTIRRRSLPG